MIRVKSEYIALFICWFAAALILFSCNKPLTKTIETKEEVRVTYKDTTIVVPSEVVSATFNYDSIKTVLNQYLKAGKTPEIIYRNSPSSPTNLKISLDSLGNLKADCKTDEQLIELLMKEVERLKSTKEVKVVKTLPDWGKYLIGALVCMLVLAFLSILSYP